MFRFSVTLLARAIASGGSVLFFAWLAFATPAGFSARLTVFVSAVTLVSFLSSAGLYPVGLRLLSRVPDKWKYAALVKVLSLSLATAVAGGMAGCLAAPLLIHERLTGPVAIAAFALVVMSAFRIVANDCLRALGVVLSVAWFEFGQVMALGGALMFAWSRLGGGITYERAIYSLTLASAALFVVQAGLLFRQATRVWRVRAPQAPPIGRLVWAYWRSIGVFAFLIGLLGSASRDLFVLTYASFGAAATIAPVALALRVWEGLSIPLVAAHSDLSAHVVGKNPQRRQAALTSLRRRVRLISTGTWIAALGVIAGLFVQPLLPQRFRGAVLLMLAVVVLCRAISSTVGLPLSLLSLHGAARKGLVVAIAQMVVLFGAVLVARGRLDGLQIVTLWCVSFLFRTAWEYWRLRSDYGVRVDVLAAA